MGVTLSPRNDLLPTLAALTATLPPCCLAALYRAAGDAVWEEDAETADRLEEAAARLVIAHGLAPERGHDPQACALSPFRRR